MSSVPRRRRYYEGATTSHPASRFASGSRPGSARSSAVRARRSAPGRMEEPPEPGPFGPPEARFRLASAWTGWDLAVPGDPIPCLCPAPRPRPNQWSLTKAAPPMLPPRPTRRRLQRSHDLEAATGLQHPLPTLRMRRCRRPRKARFRLAGWPLPGEGRTLRIATKGFKASSTSSSFSRAYPVASWAYARRKLFEIAELKKAPICDRGGAAHRSSQSPQHGGREATRSPPRPGIGNGPRGAAMNHSSVRRGSDEKSSFHTVCRTFATWRRTILAEELVSCRSSRS